MRKAKPNIKLIDFDKDEIAKKSFEQTQILNDEEKKILLITKQIEPNKQ